MWIDTSAVGYVGEKPADKSEKKDLTGGFGAVIFEMRNRKGMRQCDLAKAVGLERTSITNIELGRQKLSILTLIQIAEVLGVEMHITFKDKSDSAAMAKGNEG